MAEINIPRLKVSDSFVEWRNKFNQSLDAVQELSNSTGGGGGGAPAIAIKDEGITVTEQPISMNFTGPAVEVTSDIAGNVVVNITATGGGTDPSITPATIETPTIISPAGGSVTGGFSTSEFLVLAEEDYHKSSDWQISQFADFSVVEYELLDTKVYKRTLSIPIGILDVGTTYYIRVRHRGFTASSAYSNGVMFVAEAPINRLFKHNGEAYLPAVVFERDGVLIAYDTVYDYILRSTDGINYEPVYKMSIEGTYHFLMYNDLENKFVMISDNRYVESFDGVNWQNETSHTGLDFSIFTKVIWSSRLQRYIVVGSSSTSQTAITVGRLAVSSNGTTWTRPTNFVVNGFISDVVDTGVNIVFMSYVSFAISTNRPVYSPDLVTFNITASTMVDLGDPLAIVHAGGGTLYFVTDQSASTWKSIDHGVTWTQVTQPLYTSIADLTYTRFGSRIGNRTVFRTTNGVVEFDEININHHDLNLPISKRIYSYVNKYYIAEFGPRRLHEYTPGGTFITIRNFDGVSYTNAFTNTMNVATNGDLFVLVQNDASLYVSYDSTGKLYRRIIFPETMCNVFYENGLFIAFSTNNAYTSLNGIDWSAGVPIQGGSGGLSSVTNFVSLKWIPEKAMYIASYGRRTSKSSSVSTPYFYSFNGSEWFRGTSVISHGYGSFKYYTPENSILSPSPSPQGFIHMSNDGINWSNLYYKGIKDKIISNGRMYVAKENVSTTNYGIFRDKPENRLFFNVSVIQTTTEFVGFLEGFNPNEIFAININGQVYRINTLDDTFTISNSGVSSITRLFKTATRIHIVGSAGFVSAGTDLVWSAIRNNTTLNYVSEINGVFTYYSNSAPLYTTDFVTYTTTVGGIPNNTSALQDGNFVIVVLSNGQIYTSNDGINFTSRAAAVASSTYGISSTIKVPGKGYFVGGSSAGNASYSVDGLTWTRTTTFTASGNAFIYPPVFSSFYNAYITTVSSSRGSLSASKLIIFDELLPTLAEDLTTDDRAYLFNGQFIQYAGLTFTIAFSNIHNGIPDNPTNNVQIQILEGFLQGRRVSSFPTQGFLYTGDDFIVVSSQTTTAIRKEWTFNRFYHETLLNITVPSIADLQFAYDTGSHVYVGGSNQAYYINKQTLQVVQIDTIDNSKLSLDIMDIGFSNTTSLLTNRNSLPTPGYFLGQTPV